MKQLLSNLKNLGVKIALLDNELKIQAPKGVVNQELLQKIKLHKEEIILFLSNYASEQADDSTVTKAPVAANYPLSSSQKRLWILSQFQEADIAYNMPGFYHFSGKLDIQSLDRAFKALVDRHEILRTVFRESETGEVRQFVFPSQSLSTSIPYIDLSDISDKSEQTTQLNAIVQDAIETSFDLSTGPLIAIKLIKIESDNYLFSYIMHHIISDGWSMKVMMREMLLLYNSFVTNQAFPLEPLEIQYKDFSVWQQDQLEKGALLTQKAYWLERFSTPHQVLELPTDYLRPAFKTYRGEVVHKRINSTITGKLKKISQDQDTTLFMTLLASINVLIYKYTQQSDIVIGSPIAGRDQTILDNQIGFYVNTLALRTQFEGSDRFIDLLQRVKESTLGAYEHQMYPFDELVDSLELARDLSRNPLFDVLVVLQNTDINTSEEQQLTLGDIHVSEFSGGNKVISKFDLTFDFVEIDDQLSLKLEYSTDLFSSSTISRLLSHYEQLLESLVTNSTWSIDELGLLSAEEEVLLSDDFNSTFVDYDLEKRIADLFEEQVVLNPESLAVCFEGVQMSYQTLNARSNQLAHYLRSQGVGNNVLVGICHERSIDMIVGLLAIYKAGGAYVPLDPFYPAERLSYMVSDCAPKVILSSSQSSVTLGGLSDVTVVELDTISAIIASYPDTNLEHIGSDTLGYVIYTSGSTGQPKGVSMPERSLVNLLFWHESLYGGRGYKVLQFASLNFDASFQEIFSALCFGGSIHLVSEDDRKDMAFLLKKIEKEGIEHLFIPYVVLKNLVDESFEMDQYPSSICRIFTAGEQLRLSDKIGAFFKRTGSTLLNYYGPSETHVVTWHEVVDQDYTLRPLPPIGKPIANTTVYILDKCGGLCPVGIPGELYLGGVQVAEGYLNQPLLSAERFIPDRFKQDEYHNRLYKTGDIGRWLEDGAIEFLGRVDDQVKIRGNRVELGEVESAIESSGLVNQSVVLVNQDEHGYNYLLAYLVVDHTYNKSELLTYLRSLLPDYMIPGFFIELSEKLPITNNGKVDKSKLPKLDTASHKKLYVAPSTDEELSIAGIWSGLLGVDRIGMEDNFFELGGHSLLATRVVSAIRRDLKINLAIRDIFLYPTVGMLAAQLVNYPREEFSGNMIQRTERPARIPLSFSQERLWFIDQLEGSVQYHLPFVVRFEGFLDRDALDSALKCIVDRHEVLRTVIRKDGDDFHQVVLESLPLVVSKVTADPATIDSLIGELLALPFDLSQDLNLRATLIEQAVDDHILVVVIHHIASDGWSIPILLRELTEVYTACIEKREARLDPLDLQYSDYSIWQRSHLSGTALAKKLGYWKTTLEGSVPLSLPVDYHRSDLKSNRGSMAYHSFGESLTQRLSAYSSQQGTTLFMTLLAAFKVLLYRYSGQADICIGTPIANRTQTELEPLVGFFVNSLPLRSELSGEIRFEDFLHQVKAMTLGAYEHQEVPFEKVVEAVSKNRDMSRSPIFQVMFGLQNAAGPQASNDLPGLQLSFYPFTHTTSQFEMNFSLHQEGPSGLWGSLEYRSDLFTSETIDRFLKHYGLLLESLMTDPTLQLDAYEFMDAQEREQILSDGFNQGPSFSPDTSLVSLFEEQVSLNPDGIALVFGADELSYRELNARANQLANYLIKGGLVKGEPVCLLLDRGTDLIVSMIGTLKALGSYLPLDSDYPQERIGYMIKQANCRTIITTTHIGSFLAEGPYRIVYLDQCEQSLAEESPINPALDRSFDDLAYVMYTSGSTGLPKGVLVEDGNVVSLVKGVSYLSFTSSDRMLSTGSPSFDASTLEYWGMLLNGGRLVICSKKTLLDNRLLSQTIVENGVNKMWFTAGFLNQLVDEDPGVFRGLEVVIVGGEKLSEYHIGLLQSAYPPLQIINGYGPTENTTFSLTYSLGSAEEKGGIPIGKALENRSVFILGPDNTLCPIGVVGEICVGGLGLSRGYLQNDELTASRFIKHPFLNGARLYRTGDWGRLRSDGNVEYHGRKDDQVKIRGHRIEPGEIEQLLLQHSSIRNAVVVVKESPAKGGAAKRLVAYIQIDSTYNKDEIRAYLQGNLPDYMIPAMIYELTEFPLTPNGKVDKAALLSLNPDLEEIKPKTPARNEQEEVLVEIWQELLGIHPIGIEDDFFELGGHSLLAIRLVSSIRKRLNLEVTIGDLFDYTTIESLSGHLQVYSPQTNLMPIIGQERPARIPLSFSQERLWFIDQLEGSVQYHVPAVLRLKGNLDIDALNLALRTIIERHEVLRSVIRQEAGTPYQHIKGSAEWCLDVLDDAQYATNDELLHNTIEAFLTTPFDLENDYMLRAAVIKLQQDEQILIVVLHHIASDGWSIPIIVEELIALYHAEVNQQPCKLKELKIQYADYSIWQRTPEQEEKMEQRLAYWADQLNGVSTLQLHTDYPRPPIQTMNGSSDVFVLDKELSTAIQQFCKENGTTLFMTLLAAFKVLLYRYSGQEDICVGTPIANREQYEIEDLIGFFVNTLALRTKISGEDSFKELLQKVKEMTLQAYQHQDAPFERIVEMNVKERDLSTTPLFQVMFALQNNRTSEVQATDLAGLELIQEDIENKTTQFELIVTISETTEGLAYIFEYNTDLYKRSTIQRMMKHYEQLIRSVMHSSDTQVDDLKMLPLEEQARILEEFNGTLSALPIDLSVIDLFENQVMKTPKGIALVSGADKLSYQELNDRSNQLAHYLKKQGIPSGSLIPICMDRSIDTVIAIWGVLKAGYAYVPIDNEYPADRILEIIQETEADWVIGRKEELSTIVTNKPVVILDLVADRAKIETEPVVLPRQLIEPAGLAYVIYTSGSTGKPKGVMIEHASLVNYSTVFKKYFSLSEADKIVQQSSISFDTYVEEVFPALITGATVLIIKEGGKDIEKIKETIQKEAVTIISTTPLVLDALNKELSDNCHLRHVISGGDVLLPEHIDSFFQKVPVTNTYGPSETTVCATYHRIRKLEETSLIGKPIDNTAVYVLSKQGELCPIGVVGEITISGKGVGRGYFKQSNQTQEKFVPNPFGSAEQSKMYKTGDLGRWLSDGSLEYLGRMDEQVKIRGYRIEIGEIESVLSHCEQVRQAAVSVRIEGQKKSLVGYVVPQGKFEKEVFRTFLKSKLPDYMIPTYWVELDQLPMNQNGKIDKKALPEITQEAVLKQQYVAARNELEEKIVQIWQNLLSLERIGIEDDFFELGGHSLFVTRVVAIIRKELQINLAIRDIFLYPTIAKLSAKFSNDVETENPNRSNQLVLPNNDFVNQAQNHLLLLEKGDPDNNIFVIPGSDGFSDGYTELARTFKGKATVFGIQMFGLYKGEEPLKTIEAIAQLNIEWIRSIQPEGPYRFIGHSFGALVAFEMTKQLEDQNQNIECLGLLDMSTAMKMEIPDDRTRKEFLIQRLTIILEKYKYIQSNETAWLLQLGQLIAEMEFEDAVQYLVRFVNAKFITRKADIEFIMQVFSIIVTNAFIRYEAKGQVKTPLIVGKAENAEWSKRNDSLDWNKHAETVTAVIVPGDHFSMVKGENIHSFVNDYYSIMVGNSLLDKKG